jgi:hypothetical protein
MCGWLLVGLSLQELQGSYQQQVGPAGTQCVGVGVCEGHAHQCTGRWFHVLLAVGGPVLTQELEGLRQVDSARQGGRREHADCAAAVWLT